AHLPAQAGTALLDTARTAFTSGLSTAAIVGTAVMAGFAVLLTLMMRTVPIEAALPRPEDDAADDDKTEVIERVTA
ncbi:hypothetical protein ACIOD2_44450, partial [Amycolatopsis sp. NPDC088138]|uniref:hypothetical protein n=1 Tax=Amycolatopsis sp. NPDC088138 TaxID=3363938 RepID=UPI003826EDAA